MQQPKSYLTPVTGTSTPTETLVNPCDIWYGDAAQIRATALDAVLRLPGSVGGHPRLVMVALAWLMSPDGVSEWEQATIAKLSMVPIDEVATCLEALVADGWITYSGDVYRFTDKTMGVER